MGEDKTSSPFLFYEDSCIFNVSGLFIFYPGCFMIDEQLLKRIVINPKIMVGKPVIQGTRLTVEFVLNILAHGATIPEMINEYPGLTLEDIHACILFASKSIEDSSYMPLNEAVA